MKLVFSDHAWEDYLHWQRTDKKVLKRINTLIQYFLDHAPEEFFASTAVWPIGYFVGEPLRAA